MSLATTRGRLIALDGSAASLAAAARDVARALAAADVPRGVSHWEASGIFTELEAAGPEVTAPSARTVTLLYAADLAFRLRWQILPAIEEGRSVIAAPYIETAKALGVAAALPRKWLDELFRFAPRPDVVYHVHRGGARGAAAATQGYASSFSNALLQGDLPVLPGDLQKRSLDYLLSLEKRRRCTRLTGDVLARLGRAPSKRRRG